MNKLSSIELVKVLKIFSIAGVFLFSSCKTRNLTTDSETEAVIENKTWYANKVATKNLDAPSIEASTLDQTLDVRGVGDSGVDISNMGRVKQLWRGDLAFVNMESIVADSCSKRNSGVDYFFRSSLDQIGIALKAGFNMFSVANNHSRDCFQPYGPKITAQNMAKLSKDSEEFLWHGVAPVDQDETDSGLGESSKAYRATVKTYDIKGRKIKVAFASIAIQNWNMNGVAQIVMAKEGPSKPLLKKLLQSIADADADVRILSVHTQDGSGNNRQEDTAVKYLKVVSELFIKSYKGNLVFGSGPHTKAGIKIVEAEEGRKGVIFTSLGNFIHQGVAAHGDNLVGRAGFNIETMQLEFVQAFPVANAGGSVSYLNPENASPPNSNFKWDQDSRSFFAGF